MAKSLWGEEFNIEDNSSLIIKKAKSVKTVESVDDTKKLKSKKIPIEDKIRIIKSNVERILGSNKDNTIVITTREELHRYMDRVIENGVIAFDTETNNTLDFINCLLMGMCLYTPNQKQAYVPVNHVDLYSRNKLSNQLTEKDCAEELQRLVENNVYFILHNGKFDYQVIKSTCGICIPIDWDTLIGARLLNENEPASLKEQYILHINQEQEKYSIEKLFEKEEYAIFEPSLFALYASTDSKMTYELYLYQKNIFEEVSNKKLYNLFLTVEMPCVKVVAEMEYRGVSIDMDYCKRLSPKYHKMLDDLTEKIDEELDKYKTDIAKWRLTKEANAKSKSEDGKVGKSKSEQLEEVINLGSPTQLAILLYDVLKVPVVNKKKPRGTGKEELESIYEQTRLDLCKLLLEQKQLSKLIDSFLDTLPNEVKEKTGRIHCNYKQIGADTGRFSCTEPNLQQIPSHNREIRMMFQAEDEINDVYPTDEYYKLNKYDEVLTNSGWIKAVSLQSGNTILGDDGAVHIDKVVVTDDDIYVYGV